MAKEFNKIIITNRLYSWLVLILLFGFFNPLVAQKINRTENTNTSEIDTTRRDTVKQLIAIVDTIPISFYYQESESQTYLFSDTTLSPYFHQHDPARTQVFEWLSLGNTGSAVRPLLVDGLRPWGQDWGFHQFDLYFNSVDSLPFYKLGRALTDTYFSFKGQDNAVFRAKFSRQFQDGFQFSLKYDNINQYGQFLSQTAKISSLAAGLQYKHPNKRYTAYLTMGSHTAQSKDNGGLKTDTLFFRPGFELPETQPIRLEAAQTRQSNRKYQLYHSYKFGNTKGNYFALRHKLWYSKSSYKFFDNNKILDTVFYKAFLTDRRGVRQAFSGSSFGNEFLISFNGHRADSTEFQWLPTMGVNVVNYNTNQDPLSNRTTHVGLVGRWNIQLGQIFHLAAKGQFGLVGNAGDYNLSGRLGVETKRVGDLMLFTHLQSVTPSLLAQNNYITRSLVWSHDFKKEFINKLGGSYSLPKYRMSFGASINLLTNHIYYGLGGQVKQELKTIPISQLFFRKEFKVRGFHLANDLLYQSLGSEVIRRPKLYLSQQLYWKGFLFDKALYLKMGVGSRYFSAWQPDAYQPAIGQFVLQDSLSMPAMPSFDAFVTFQVKTFRFLAKMENLQYYWDKRIFYQTALYPQFRPTFRLGVAWLFRD